MYLAARQHKVVNTILIWIHRIGIEIGNTRLIDRITRMNKSAARIFLATFLLKLGVQRGKEIIRII